MELYQYQWVDFFATKGSQVSFDLGLLAYPFPLLEASHGTGKEGIGPYVQGH
jgi:hypothetical protein